jgi:hypothetical protein
MSVERIIHAIAGLVLLAAFLSLRGKPVATITYVPLILAALLGTWVPDWDLFLGIGFHRSPITHSAAPAMIALLLPERFRLPSALTGFSLGLSSHLIWDIVFYGNVQMISGGNNDRLFLFINACLLIVYAAWVGRRIGSSSDRIQARG